MPSSWYDVSRTLLPCAVPGAMYSPARAADLRRALDGRVAVNHPRGLPGGREGVQHRPREDELLRGAMDVDGGGIPANRDRLLHASHSQLRIHRRGEVRWQLNAFPSDRAEPGQREGDGVEAGP